MSDQARGPIFLGLPEDERVLAAIGKISIRHGQLDLSLKMLIKALTGVTRAEAEAALEGETSSGLRERAKRLARKMPEGPNLIRLQALLTRAKRATRHRNELMHSLWAEDPGRGTVIQREGGVFEDVPKLEELEAVVEELTAVAYELNGARLDGFLTESLRQLATDRDGLSA